MSVLHWKFRGLHIPMPCWLQICSCLATYHNSHHHHSHFPDSQEGKLLPFVTFHCLVLSLDLAAATKHFLVMCHHCDKMLWFWLLYITSPISLQCILRMDVVALWNFEVLLWGCSAFSERGPVVIFFILSVIQKSHPWSDKYGVSTSTPSTCTGVPVQSSLMRCTRTTRTVQPKKRIFHTCKWTGSTVVYYVNLQYIVIRSTTQQQF